MQNITNAIFDTFLHIYVEIIPVETLNDFDDEDFIPNLDMNPEEIKEKYYLEILTAMLSNSEFVRTTENADIVEQAKVITELAYNHYYHE